MSLVTWAVFRVVSESSFSRCRHILKLVIFSDDFSVLWQFPGKCDFLWLHGSVDNAGGKLD